MMNHAMTPFGRYVRLYTLHHLEHPLVRPDVAQLIVLRVRIETLRYSFVPLNALPLDDAYAADPREGAELVRETVLPRLYTLLESDDPWAAVGRLPGRDVIWQQYAAARGLPADPVRVPAIHAPQVQPLLPAQGVVSQRLAQIHRAMAMVQTAVETASSLAALWQNWQIGQEQRQLLSAQRQLLQSTVQAQIATQNDALSRGEDRPFVRGYLAGQGDDPVHDLVFGEPDEE